LTEQIVIPGRFNGPPATAHGGYACATVAELFDWSAEVSLRAAPPLDRPLPVRRAEDGSVTVLDGETVVMQGRAAGVDVDVPEPVSLADAEAAAAACPWFDGHPFPTCFGCGPERAVGDGMREFPGPVPGRPEVWATPWIPDASLAGPDGDVLPIFTFAALDCPSAAGAIEAAGHKGVHVLGRLTGRVLGSVRVGEPHVVMAWPVGSEGRKSYGGVAVLAGDRLCAVGEALWIALRDPDTFGAQVKAFG